MNSAGANYSANQTFTTLPLPPTVTTTAASGIGSSSATLNGTVHPQNATTTVYFQYGLNTSYGSFSTTNTVAAGGAAVPVNRTISGLLPGALYHFRTVAINNGGTNFGADLTFTITAVAPTATTLAATSVSASGASLNASINPNGTTTVYFEYGPTTA